MSTEIQAPNAPLSLDRTRGAPGYPFAICSPYNDGLGGTAVVGAFAYKPHALFFMESPAMVAALRDDLDQFEQMERMFSDDSEFMAALEQTRAILSRIDGETPTDEPATPTGEFRTIRADHLAALAEAAGKYADDLETGLEDGTYEDRADLEAVQAAIAAVKGDGDTKPAAPGPQWVSAIIRKNWEPRLSVFATEEDLRADLLEYARDTLEIEGIDDGAPIADIADVIGEEGRDQVYWGEA